MKRILSGVFKHETNTFSPLQTDLLAYASRSLLRCGLAYVMVVVSFACCRNFCVTVRSNRPSDNRACREWRME